MGFIDPPSAWEMSSREESFTSAAEGYSAMALRFLVDGHLDGLFLTMDRLYGASAVLSESPRYRCMP